MKRKFNFNNLTSNDLETIAAEYPNAVETITIRKPVYKILAMLATCNVKMPDGIKLTEEGAPILTFIKEQNKKASIADISDRELPPVKKL